jgi:tight adherence protein B
MIALAAATCVFAAAWIISLPSPSTLRLTSLLRQPTRTRQHAVSAHVVRLRGALGRRRKETETRRTSVIELCDAIAAELTAGRPPATALIHAADVLTGLPALTPTVEAAKGGDDVADALDHAARTPGCDGLRLLAGCWRIGVDRGGMLAAVIEGLADALRDEQSHREDVTLQLAGPRATARLLAVLPLLGLAMAVALGAHPFGFLFGTLPGLACLSLGAGLDALGVWWTHRLTRAAEESR